MTKWALLVAAVLMAPPARAQGVRVTPLIDARLRWERVDQDGLPRRADAVTARVRSGIKADVGHLQALVESEATLAITERYNSGINGLTRYPLVVDPEDIELNRAQLRYQAADTAADPVTSKAFTTRPLMRCFDAAAAAFGWAERSPRSRATFQDGWWIGHGCAAAARPVKIGPASIRVAQDGDGNVRVETAHHEIGNGLYTLLATIASERLDVPLDRVTVVLGDTALPPAGISGGSSTTTSLANALAKACAALLRKPEGAREVHLDYLPAGTKPDALEALQAGHIKLLTLPEDGLAWAFGAHMVEVRVHALTGEVRVPRHVGAFAAGRVLNPITARSQYLGGMAWGLSSALLEKTELDPRTGIYMNRDLAEYLVPTSADIAKQTVIMVADEDAAVNPEGIKGLGEIGIIGVAAAVANAVFNATGVRLRDLPIRPEAMLG